MSSTTRWECDVPAEAAPHLSKFELFQSVAYDALLGDGNYPAELGDEPEDDGSRDGSLHQLRRYAEELGIPKEMAEEHIEAVIAEEADGGWEPVTNADGGVTVSYDDVSSLFGCPGFDLAVQHALALAGSDAAVSYHWAAVDDGSGRVAGSGEVRITRRGKSP